MKTSLFLFVAAALISSAARALPVEIAPISAVQVDAIKIAFPTNLKNKQLATALAEARETITEFMKVESCLGGNNSSPLNKFAAPGKVYFDLVNMGPMKSMSSHSKNACVTVNRIHGFGMPTKNTLSFEVVFAAEDSGEMSKHGYLLQKQDDGAWLFK